MAFGGALGGAAVGLLLAGCAAAPLAAINTLARFGDYRRTSGIAYAAGPRHALDIYQPAAARQSPVVVFLYGGGWEDGDRADYRFVGAALAARGVVVVIPDYRLFPEVRYPGFLEDCAAAVRWTQDHVAAYGGDPGRIILMGHSAGAYNAAMLTLDRRWLRAAGAAPPRAMIGLAGPYDFLPLRSEVLKTIFGPEETRAATQPIQYVSAGAPPVFLAAGDDDRTVDPGNTERLAARLRGAGDAVTVARYPGVDHKAIIGALSPPLRGFAPVLRDVMRFIGTVS
jgi:acetyl esterase/lipase